jgi:hypothetical protein
MKTYRALLIFIATVLVACNIPTAQPTSSSKSEEGTKGNSKKKGELNISAFVPCIDCEFEGELVNPLPKDWSDSEKELYRVMIDFWEQTTGFLFTSEMIELYKSEGPEACQDRFVKVISGELKSNENTVAGEDPIRAYGWRDHFGKSAIGQMQAAHTCEVEEAEPAIGTEAYDKWKKAVFKCIDIVFYAGEPVCFYVERPIIHDPNTAIVRLRLYDTVDSEGYLHLVSAFCFYYKQVNGDWHFELRRDK